MARAPLRAGVVAAAALGGCIFPARPQPPRYGEAPAALVDGTRGWTRLGQRSVKGRAQRSVIALRRHGPAFATVKIRAEHGGVELDAARVVFADGTSFEPRTRLVIPGRDLESAARATRRQAGDQPHRVPAWGRLPTGHELDLELWAQ